jgi:hypothetical protein
MAMKPLPKAILIIAVVAGAGFALNAGLSVMKTSTPPVATVTEPVVEQTVVVQQSAPVPAVEQPAATPATPSTGDASADRGLAQLLQQGKR